MKDFKDTIQKIKENPKGKAILFFGFYLVFFTVVILFVRFSSRYQTNSSDYEKGSSLTGQIRYLLSENYEYQFHITKDGEVEDIIGKRLGEEETFTYLNDQYYCKNDNCYVEKEMWLKSEQPNPYSRFLDPNKLASLLDQSKLESKTSYESGKTSYNYLVLVDTMYQVFYDTFTDLDLPVDSIVLQSDENQQLSSIIFQLNSFCKYQKICDNSLKIEVFFHNIGMIENIEKPVF